MSSIFDGIIFLNESEDYNKWKYKVDLKDDIFKSLEDEYGIKIPSNLRQFIKDHNGTTPTKNRFIATDKMEYVFGGVLSFNKKDDTGDAFVLSVLKDFNVEYLPFATDPSGNLICMNIKSHGIFIWNHEIDKFIKVSQGLESLLKSLY